MSAVCPAVAAANLHRTTIYLLNQASSLCHFLQIHALTVKTSLHLDIFILAKFLRQCLASGHPAPEALHYARAVFESFPSPDAFIWNTMIRAYLRADDPRESVLLFDRMCIHGSAFVDSFSLSLVLQACGRAGDGGSGRRVHGRVWRLGFASDLFVGAALVEMYAKIGRIETSRQMFDEMPERDLVLRNIMLAVYVRLGHIESARQLFDEMPDRDLVSWNTLIHGYSMNGNVGAARQLFDSNCERDLVSWSSMIAAYSKSRQSNEALRLFQEMQLAKVSPDGATMVSVLSACGEIGALGMGKTVHEYIERNQIVLDMKLGTALIDMYAKCGDIDNSLKVFNGMHYRDVLTWSAMIIGLANHGLGEAALELFMDMVSRGIEPNEITFVGVLCACCHVCFVSQGWEIFSSMTEKYGINPTMEHYGCMVDLLSRSGHLLEAVELVRSMPFEPDAVIWRSLLGGCRIHKNVELAEEAVDNLIRLEPHVDGHYVLLSNIYAQAKRWDGVVNVRKMMRGMNISRVPGCSSIEVDNMVHEFVSGDKSHPNSSGIYAILDEMIRRLKDAGYRSMTDLVLQDLDEQAKEELLFCHSEKLALAFGLLSTPHGSPVRIVKNLRVCDDCHCAIKLVSTVYNRVVVVRDRNRFHHFINGSCSCGDYW